MLEVVAGLKQRNKRWCHLYLHVCHGEWREHPSVLCVRAYVCEVGKAAVSHPRANVACYHGSHSRFPTSPWAPFFFFFTHLSSLSTSSFAPPPSPSPPLPFSSLTHRWLPHHHQWHHHPLPDTVLWWFILYVETFSAPLLSPTSRANVNVGHSFMKSQWGSRSFCLWLLWPSNNVMHCKICAGRWFMTGRVVVQRAMLWWVSQVKALCKWFEKNIRLKNVTSKKMYVDIVVKCQ